MWKALLWLIFLVFIVFALLNAPPIGTFGTTGLITSVGSGMGNVSAQVLDEIVKMALPILKNAGMAALNAK